ncbi:MAG: hypothetical protein E7173_00410 [Firmicutes bacterium]|nr:hypothetical protein [Bacillota bacterium]
MKLKKKISDELNNVEAFVVMKKLWQSPRYRSIFWLIVYFIFFAIIISSLQVSYKKQDNKGSIGSTLNVTEVLNNMKDYSYEILLNDEQSIIVGEVKKNFHTFAYDNEQYSIVGDNIYLEQNDNLIKTDLTSKIYIPIQKITLDKLDDYVIGQENIKSKDKIQYNLKNSDIIDNQNIDFSMTFYGTATIDKITLDFSQYVKSINADYDQYILTIKVGDINHDDNNIGSEQ